MDIWITNTYIPIKIKTFIPQKIFSSNYWLAKCKLIACEWRLIKSKTSDSFSLSNSELKTYLAILDSSRIIYNDRFTHESKCNPKALFNFLNSLFSAKSFDTSFSFIGNDFFDYLLSNYQTPFKNTFHICPRLLSFYHIYLIFLSSPYYRRN